MNPKTPPPAPNPLSSAAPPLGLAFAVFAGGYFLSYAMRAVNAVLSPDLRAELLLTPEALGWLTAAYLIAFAAMQLPLGIWLDRYGARRVESALLVIAALGCALFASGHSFIMLSIARGLIGLGVSACLMAAFTSYRQWYAPELMSRLAAWMMVAGISGALAATVPARLLSDAQGWRAVFWIAAAAFLLVATAMWGLLPKQAKALHETGAAPVTYAAIFRRQSIRASLPVAFFSQGGFLALQTLWAAQWFTQVLGQSSAQAAQSLLMMNTVLLIVYLAIGIFGGKLSLAFERRLIFSGFTLCAASLLGIVLWQAPQSWVLWLVMAATSTGNMLLQARVSVSLPKAISGRGNVALNIVIFIGGFLLQGGIGWAATSIAGALGLSTAQGMAVTFAALALTQFAAVAWLWLNWRSARNFDEHI